MRYHRGMNKIIKAMVIAGRHQGAKVRITNLSADELGRQKAACLLPDGTRANILVQDLSILNEAPEPTPTIRRAQTSSMPFISGSSSSRTLTHTRNMGKLRPKIRGASKSVPRRQQMAKCASCGAEYDQAERQGCPGKITDCQHCAQETESKMEGTMIFSHKTGATIEIKKDGELRHEADIFDPKNKT